MSALPRPLPSRDRCMFSGCNCGGFVLFNPSEAAQSIQQLPATASDPCGCSHPWQSHAVQYIGDETDEHYASQKGRHAPTNCGGFFSYESQWQREVLCTCSSPWYQHENLPARSRRPALSPAPAITLGTSIASSSTLAPPISVFTAALRDPGGNTQSRRVASYQRAASQGSGGRALRSSSQFAQPTREDNCMIAIYPFSLKKPADQPGLKSPSYTFASEDLTDFLNTLSVHSLVFRACLSQEGEVWLELDNLVAEHCTQHHLVLPGPPTSESEPLPTPRPFHKLSWQFLAVRNVNHRSQKRFQAADKIVATTFTLSSLIKYSGVNKVTNPLDASKPLFVLVPRYGNLQGPISSLLEPDVRLSHHDQVHACFALRIMHRHPQSVMAAPECFPDICPTAPLPLASSVSDITEFSVPETLMASPVPEAGNVGQSDSWPLGTAVVRPRSNSSVMEGESERSHHRRRLDQDSEAAPTSDQVRTVTPMRVDAALDESLAPTPDSTTTTSTSASGAPAPVNAPPTRPSVGVVNPPTAVLTPIMVPPGNSDVVVFTGVPLDVAPMLADTVAPPGERSRAVSAEQPGMVDRWLRMVERELRHFAGPEQTEINGYVSYRGPDVESVADTMFRHLVWQHSGCHGHFEATHQGVTYMLCELRAFLNPRERTYRMCDSRGRALGRGPERTTYRYLVQTFTSQTDYWQSRGPYQSLLFPDLQEPISTRVSYFRACGTIAALHIIHLGLPPVPISPFLILAVLVGKGRLEPDETWIRGLDPEAADVLHPWFLLGPQGQIPEGFSDPPSLARGIVAADERQALFRGVVASVLLGKSYVWNHPDFEAFAQGFDILFSANPGSDSVVKLFSSRNHVQLDPETLIYTLYNRTVQNASSLVTHLAFSSDDVSGSETNAQFEELFQYSLIRYLKGSGHPDHVLLRQTHPSLYDGQESGDLALALSLRARLLLIALTDSDLAPVGEDWNLKFRFVHMNTVSGNNMDPDAEPTIYIHTCTSSCDIPLNTWLKRALLERRDFSSSEPATLFDCWLHRQIVFARADYTRI
ncbi:hypothetical protein BV25DRAFT_1901442 [Artomyces pyxidatus]|uniref:Uncharacterized protein n=1 Tax=Artomyces pyxidatus TaxID=48021 RepID=A0ACB8SVJ1_9AGAM|nr:hypothetical protein BV25DRAFT_1901442 [Artomyces pyxidatus]